MACDERQPACRAPPAGEARWHRGHVLHATGPGFAEHGLLRQCHPLRARAAPCGLRNRARCPPAWPGLLDRRTAHSLRELRVARLRQQGRVRQPGSGQHHRHDRDRPAGEAHPGPGFQAGNHRFPAGGSGGGVLRVQVHQAQGADPRTHRGPGRHVPVRLGIQRLCIAHQQAGMGQAADARWGNQGRHRQFVGARVEGDDGTRGADTCAFERHAATVRSDLRRRDIADAGMADAQLRHAGDARQQAVPGPHAHA